MSDEKLTCPMCGGETFHDGEYNTIDCYDCNFMCSSSAYSEISAALAYYREHKYRRCENCGKLGDKMSEAKTELSTENIERRIQNGCK